MTRPLDLPPPYRAVVLREHRCAFAHAQAIAGEAGAGTLVWVRRFDAVEIAVVLEPAEPLRAARRALYAVMNAAGDALAAHCPPEKPLAFAWPDTIRLDGGIVGGARLAWPEAAAEDCEPDWLVAGLMLRLAVPHTRRGPGDALAATGEHPPGHPLDIRLEQGTSLEIEGFEMMDAGELIGSFARHLMVHVDRWQEAGFAAVARDYLARLPEEKAIRRGIDGNGDLLVRRLQGKAGESRQDLVQALGRPQWLDPETGDPWL